MTHLHDPVEPTIIDEALLRECVEEQGPLGEAGKIAKNEGIDFIDVIHLQLDYKNILKIANLWQFSKLTKLQLDNNIIEKIEGLDALVHLEWLDLSFNNIEVIAGLEKLTKLRDLTLFNNRISLVENMDTLVDLQVFSVGNNNLQSLENMVYLRRFKHLNTLNLSGNPFCKTENYHSFIIAYLPSLIFLDYRLIDAQNREIATEKYRYAIEELAQDEAVEIRKKEEERVMLERRIAHKAGYVEDLNGTGLFVSMFGEDAEAEKLSQLPGVKTLLHQYEEKFVAICQQLFDFGLKERDKRRAEADAFFSSLYEAVENNKSQSVLLIEKYEESKLKVFAELMHVSEQQVLEVRLHDLTEEVTELWDSLMGLELQLVDQLEETIKDFERAMSDLVGTFVENVQGFIAQCRDLENLHHEKLSDIAVVTLEKLMKNELEEEVPDDVRMLFIDRDTIMNAVSASHDAHLMQIDNKEDDIVTRARSDMQTVLENIHTQEINRNRARVFEINNLLDHYRDELESFEVNVS